MIGTYGKFRACLRGRRASKQSYSCLRSRVNRLGKFTGPDSIFMQMQNRRLKAQWDGRYKWLDDHLQPSSNTDLAHSCHLCIYRDVWTSHFLSETEIERGMAPSDLTMSHCLMLTECCKNSITLLFNVRCGHESKPTCSRKKVIKVVISSVPQQVDAEQQI